MNHYSWYHGEESDGGIEREKDMKAAAVSLLIVLGTLLILAPVAAGVMHQSNVTRLMESGHNQVQLQPPLSSDYAASCWVAGAAMIVVAVLLAVWFTRREPQP